MFESQRRRVLSEMKWNEASDPNKHSNIIATLECWKYEGLKGVEKNTNLRVTSLANQSRDRGTVQWDVENRLTRWLQCEGQYRTPTPPIKAGALVGGLRVILCERIGTHLNTSMSRAAYERVEESFKLHAAALPLYSFIEGSTTRFVTRNDNGHITEIDLLIKAKKKEIGNPMIVMHYDVSTRFTTAWMCGQGAASWQACDQYLNGRSQLEHLTESVADLISLWDHPVLLPLALLKTYTIRTQAFSRHLDEGMIDLENHLGITRAGYASPRVTRQWPLDVDTEKALVPLQSLPVEATFMVRKTQWLGQLAAFIEALASELAGNPGLLHLDSGFQEVTQYTQVLKTLTPGLEAFFLSLKDRAVWQNNLLFSVINQQDSAQNQWHSRLQHMTAKAAKQDSISVATFTFIAALFLPGTFVATLFSMTMFDWQPDGSSPTNQNSADSPSSPSISNKFWIFWTIVIPLTSITMVGWYVWFRYASRKWDKILDNELADAPFQWSRYKRPTGKYNKNMT